MGSREGYRDFAGIRLGREEVPNGPILMVKTLADEEKVDWIVVSGTNESYQVNISQLQELPESGTFSRRDGSTVTYCDGETIDVNEEDGGCQVCTQNTRVELYLERRGDDEVRLRVKKDAFCCCNGKGPENYDGVNDVFYPLNS